MAEGSLKLVRGSAAKNESVQELASRLDSARARLAKAAKAAKEATESQPIMDGALAFGGAVGAAAADSFLPSAGPVPASALVGVLTWGAGWAMESPTIARAGAMMLVPSVYAASMNAIASMRG